VVTVAGGLDDGPLPGAEVAAELHPTTRQHVAAAITRQPSLGIAASTPVNDPLLHCSHHVTTSEVRACLG
jgi:hypothetical protein